MSPGSLIPENLRGYSHSGRKRVEVVFTTGSTVRLRPSSPPPSLTLVLPVSPFPPPSVLSLDPTPLVSLPSPLPSSSPESVPPLLPVSVPPSPVSDAPGWGRSQTHSSAVVERDLDFPWTGPNGFWRYQVEETVT